MLRFIKPLHRASILAFALMVPTLGHANTVITLQEARLNAPVFLQQGNLQAASALAVGLLKANPNDITGIIVQSSILQRVGKFAPALDLAKRGFGLANTKVERFSTAAIIAQSLIGLNKFERSKYWLRIASQNASTVSENQNVASLYKRVRAASPWRTNLAFNITPSDNVNNGTTEKELYGCLFFGCVTLPINNAQPLSGIIIQASGAMTYRLKSSKTNQLSIGADISHQHVELTGKDRKESIYKGSDFNYTYIGGHLDSQDLWVKHGITFGSRLSFGRSWVIRPQVSGNEVIDRPSNYSDRIQLRFSARKTLTKKRRVSGAFDATLNQDHTDNIRSTKRLGLQFTDEYILPNRDRISYTLAASETNSASRSTAHNASSVTLKYIPTKRLGNISAIFSAGISIRDDKEFGISPQKRHDTAFNLSASFKFNSMNLFGFAPVAIVQTKRTKSNNPLYDNRQLQMRLNLETKF